MRSPRRVVTALATLAALFAASGAWHSAFQGVSLFTNGFSSW